jgi:hypothetical protein
MAKGEGTMNRLTHLILALACAGLMILLLALAVGAEGPVQPSQSVIKVPDDYPTIQAAIDAAAEGDEILVASGHYTENLSINKGITLSGGWNISFTLQNTGDLSVILGMDTGRAISITGTTSDTVVAIDSFYIQDGNATGLGGPAEVSAVMEPEGSETALAADPLTPAERLARLQTDLAGVVERGLYPGGSAAYRSMLDRVQQQIARLEQAGPLPPASASPSQEGIDCGGAIYSWNASLHLSNCSIDSSVGSLIRDGCGGGVFVGKSPLGGVVIRGNRFTDNVASTTPYYLGRGGGIFAMLTPGLVVEGNEFRENAAGSAGPGIGGGLYVRYSPGVVVRDNEFVRNTGGGGWGSEIGTGGGAALYSLLGATVAHNQFHENLGGVHGQGNGGGLMVNESRQVVVADNDLTGNWACMFQAEGRNAGGGGIALWLSTNVTVTRNVIQDNTATVSAPFYGSAKGGGLYGEEWEGVRILDNTFSGNVASLTQGGDGGGAAVRAGAGNELAGNSFVGNTASLTGDTGGGGGLYLLNTHEYRVQGNTFRDNLAITSGQGEGGGLCVVSEGSNTRNTIVDANLFLNNRADTDPAAILPSLGGACFFMSDGLAFTNNVVAGNSAGLGGGLELGITQRGEVINNTLVGNSDEAIVVDPANDFTPITFTNNIVVSHTVGISVGLGTTATVGYTLWGGNGADIAGPGTVYQDHPVTGDPAFVDLAADNYHLSAGSPAINAGDPAGVPPAPDHDADGVVRPQGPAVDLGAYEWRGQWLYLPLVCR